MEPTRFPPPPARHNASSQAAAEAVRTQTPGQRERVHAYVAGCGPVTREQVSKATGLPLQSVSPRVNELLEAKLLRVVDEAGRTIAGCRAERLMVTGRAYAETPPPSMHQMALPLSAVPSERQPNVAQPPTSDWAAVEAELTAAGVQLASKALAAARDAGATVQEVRLAIAHFHRLSGIAPLALYRKISQLRPGESLETNWPMPALEQRFAALSTAELAALREQLFARLPFLRERFARKPADAIVRENLLEQFRRESAGETQ